MCVYLQQPSTFRIHKFKHDLFTMRNFINPASQLGQDHDKKCNITVPNNG